MILYNIMYVQYMVCVRAGLSQLSNTAGVFHSAQVVRPFSSWVYFAEEYLTAWHEGPELFTVYIHSKKQTESADIVYMGIS